MKKLSIIIPVFNEERTVGKLLKYVSSVDFNKWKREIIIIDDGSTDNSKFKIQEAITQLADKNIRVIYHRKNKGKGAAVQTGFKAAKGDAVVIQDADLEYDPKDLPELIKKMEKSGVDVVMGSRNLNLKQQILQVWGINLSTFLINLLYGSRMSDLYTCYKLINIKALRSIQAKSTGFEWDIEIMVKLLKKGYKVSEVSISYHPRSFMEGKKIKPWDGIVGLWIIVKNRIF